MASLQFNFYSAITIASSIFSSIIGILILVKGGDNRRFHLPFVLFIFASNVGMFDIGLLMHTGNFRVLPHLLSISTIAVFLLGPLLYIYLQSIVAGKKNIHSFIHFFPALLVLLFLLNFFLLPGNEKIQLFEQYLAGDIGFIDSLQYGSISIFGILHMFAYHALSCIILLRYKKSVAEHYSTLPAKILSWVKSIAWALFLSDMILCAAMVLSIILLQDIAFLHSTLVFVIPVLLNYLIFRILYMPELFFSGSNRDLFAVITKNDGISPNPVQAQNIETIVQREGLYKDMNLTLSDLASRVDIPRTMLSSLINKHFNVNFYDFINRFRINEVKRIIELMPEDVNILDTATAAGFKSKTTFNACFKRFEKMTPTQYKSIILNASNGIK